MPPVLLNPYRLVAANSGYSAMVLADGPSAYYRLGESSGTTLVDSSGNGRDGSYSGTVTLGTGSLVNGDVDKAVTFGGGAGAVPSAAWQTPGSFTIEFRVKPNAIGGYRTIYQASGGHFVRIDNVGNYIAFFVYFGGGYQYVTTGVAAVAGRTYTVTATYDAPTKVLRLYIDGVQMGTATGPGSGSGTANTTTGAFSIGAYPSLAEPYTGVVDEFSLTPSVLTPARIFARHLVASGQWANTGSASASTWAAQGTPGQTPLPTGSSGTSVAPTGVSPVATAYTLPSPFATSSAQTIEMWFKKPAAAVASALFSIGGGAGGWAVGLGASDLVTNGNNLVLYRAALAWHTIGSVSTGVHHLVVTRSGGTISIYFDGALSWSTNPGTINAPSDLMLIGSLSLYSQDLPSSVLMDKVALYNTVLSGARITAHYNGGAGSDSAVAADSPIVLLELDAIV